jgi:hypothetical protein
MEGTVTATNTTSPLSANALLEERDRLREIIRTNLERFNDCPCIWCNCWNADAEQHCCAAGLNKMRAVYCEWLR